MEIKNVHDPEFGTYGRVITGYEVSGLMREMMNTPLPEGVVYVGSVPALEEVADAAALADGVYGGMPTQLGYCNGHNLSLITN